MQGSSEGCHFPRADFQANLDGAACIGAWSYDPGSELLAASPILAARLGIAPRTEWVELEAALSGIHPNDRLRIESTLHAARSLGSPFEAEFQTGRGPEARWLRLMGSAGRADPLGRSVIRGLAFDLTESRISPGTPAQRAQHQTNQLADHVVAMQGLVACLRNPSVAAPFEQLKKAIGIEIARHLYASRSRNTQ